MSEKQERGGQLNKLVIGLLAHVDAGKTTLAEGILYKCGEIRSLGRVDHQDCFLDTDEVERSRGITIFSKEAHASWKNLELTILDTPGHVDFSSEMERTLSVLDAAVLVISGADGVQGHTQTLWRLLQRYQIPTFLFVNKMDLPQSNRESILKELQKKLGSGCVDFQDQETLYEELSLCHEDLLEEYLETESISEDLISDMIGERCVFPVYFGSALNVEKDVADSIDDLLDGLAALAPIPEYPEEFGARVFKITRDDTGKRLTHLKITGGRLLPKQLISGRSSTGAAAHSGAGGDVPGDSEEVWQEKADQLRSYRGDRFIPMTEGLAGEIVAVTGLTKTFAGQGLGMETENEIPSLEPVLEYRIELPEGVDGSQALPKFRILEEEDPQLHIVWQEEGKEIHVQVMGQIQTQVLKDKILERFGMDVGFGNGRIVYRETIFKPSYGIGHFEPLRHYAEVGLLLEPGEPGSGIQFASVCSEDVLDKNWQRLIRTHVEETIHPGVLTRSEVTDLRVILVTGRAHPKHTEGGDFRQATYRAIRNALRKAENVLLEPMYRFVLEVPTEYIGRAMMDVERAFGKPGTPVVDGEYSILVGRVPVSTFQDYQLELQAYTSGRGRLTLALDGFAPCHNAEEVVEGFGYDPEGDVRRPTGSVFCAHGAGFQVPWDEVENYAHTECTIDLEGLMAKWESSGEGAEDLLKSGKVAVKSSDELLDKPLAGAKMKKASGVISVEEIDAILASTFRKQSEDNGRYKRYHKNSRRFGKEPVVSSPKLPPKKLTPTKGYFLVDGYNMIFAWKELSELAESTIDGARDRLIDICCDYQGYIGDTLILVFDAYKVKGNVGSVSKIGNIYVVYTKEAETADAYIERATHELAGSNRVTVATSDRLEQMIIWGNGALRMSAGEFEKAYEESHRQMKERHLDQESSLEYRPFANIHLED